MIALSGLLYPSHLMTKILARDTSARGGRGTQKNCNIFLRIYFLEPTEKRNTS
jgi:hypothetical protein